MSDGLGEPLLLLTLLRDLHLGGTCESGEQGPQAAAPPSRLPQRPLHTAGCRLSRPLPAGTSQAIRLPCGQPRRGEHGDSGAACGFFLPGKFGNLPRRRSSPRTLGSQGLSQWQQVQIRSLAHRRWPRHAADSDSPALAAGRRAGAGKGQALPERTSAPRARRARGEGAANAWGDGRRRRHPEGPPRSRGQTSQVCPPEGTASRCKEGCRHQGRTFQDSV